jgi:hypothetical protein
MWESNTIYNSDIDFEAFKTKKSAINSVIEIIIDINETNDSFLKKRMKEGGEINNNNDIQSALKLIQKASDISDKNNYLNCDLFCHEMVDNRTFKKDFNIVPFKINTKKNFENQYNDLINVLEVGDIVAFGEKNNVRHYAIYIGNDDVLEVEMWGGKPRKFSLKTNLYNYENVPYIYREKNSSFIQGGEIDKQDSVTMNIPLLIRTLELAREDVFKKEPLNW